MRTWTRALLFCVATTSVAVAQPQPTPQPMPGDPTMPTDPMQPQPPPLEPQPQPPPPEPPPPPPAPEAAPVDHTARPPGLTVGIGAGYLLPDSLETPNITSVRFRLESGLTLEPVVQLSQFSRTVDTGDSSTDTRRDLGVGALIRHTLKSKGRYDLDVLGGAFVSTTLNSPDADDADSSTTNIDLVYGLSIATWINEHWTISFSALNPVVNYTRNRQEQGPDAVLVNSDLLIGAIWNPTVTAMVHLYY